MDDKMRRLLTGLFVLNFLDAILTLVWIQVGFATEANPIMDAVMLAPTSTPSIANETSSSAAAPSSRSPTRWRSCLRSQRRRSGPPPERRCRTRTRGAAWRRGCRAAPSRSPRRRCRRGPPGCPSRTSSLAGSTKTMSSGWSCAKRGRAPKARSQHSAIQRGIPTFSGCPATDA